MRALPFIVLVPIFKNVFIIGIAALVIYVCLLLASSGSVVTATVSSSITTLSDNLIYQPNM